jgi:hypothetical protein
MRIMVEIGSTTIFKYDFPEKTARPFNNPSIWGVHSFFVRN